MQNKQKKTIMCISVLCDGNNKTLKTKLIKIKRRRQKLKKKNIKNFHFSLKDL